MRRQVGDVSQTQRQMICARSETTLQLIGEQSPMKHRLIAASSLISRW